MDPRVAVPSTLMSNQAAANLPFRTRSDFSTVLGAQLICMATPVTPCMSSNLVPDSVSV